VSDTSQVAAVQRVGRCGSEQRDRASLDTLLERGAMSLASLSHGELLEAAQKLQEAVRGGERARARRGARPRSSER
jgi:hypothetical protein